MKKILLSSAAVLAFAGTATAGSDYGSILNGDATFKYNDVNGGFDFGVGLSWTGKAMLMNGWEASGSLDIDLRDDGPGSSTAFDLGHVETSDWVLGLTNGTFSLNIGDVAPAQDKAWSGTTNMGADGFNDEGDAEEEFVILIGAMFGGTSLYFSTLADSTGATSGNALGLKASLGGVDITAAWQDYSDVPVTSHAFAPGAEIFGLSAGTTVGGVDVKVAYASNTTTSATSTGFSVSYPIGAVTVGAFYSIESATADNYGVSVDYAANDLKISAFIHEGADEDNQLAVEYTMGDMALFAGTREDDGSWIGLTYDLGGGASVEATWTDDTGADDEVGPNDWEDGLTIEFGYKFTM